MPDADDNNDCFVVSPIGERGTPTYKRAKNVLDYIIKPAAESVGLNAVRADDLSQPGSITTQIIQQLINAKAVVADLTDLNPNVFYELAVRDSFGAPVVLIAENGTKLPFDLIQQRTIFFDSNDLSSAIPAIKAIAGALNESLKDPGGASPVKAAVDLNSLRSGNAEERQVAQLTAKVEQMARQLAALEHQPSWSRFTRKTMDLLSPASPVVEGLVLSAVPVEELLKVALVGDDDLVNDDQRRFREQARQILVARGVKPPGMWNGESPEA